MPVFFGDEGISTRRLGGSELLRDEIELQHLPESLDEAG
jgi:hypothetical protein